MTPNKTELLPTPRTDSAVINEGDLCDQGYKDSPYVYADFARQLERELALTSAALKEAIESSIETFESIRSILVDHLKEPERRAFWSAVAGRDRLRKALTNLQPKEEAE